MLPSQRLKGVTGRTQSVLHLLRNLACKWRRAMQNILMFLPPPIRAYWLSCFHWPHVYSSQRAAAVCWVARSPACSTVRALCSVQQAIGENRFQSPGVPLLRSVWKASKEKFVFLYIKPYNNDIYYHIQCFTALVWQTVQSLLAEASYWCHC